MEQWQDQFYAAKFEEHHNKRETEKLHEKFLKKRVMRAWKLFKYVKGNEEWRYQQSLRVTEKIEKERHEQTCKLNAMKEMVQELEEQRIMEAKQKEMLKHKLDQIHLRGASTLQMDSLQASQTTLNSFYAGIKMPKYDGDNILQQLQLMNNHTKKVVKKVTVDDTGEQMRR